MERRIEEYIKEELLCEQMQQAAVPHKPCLAPSGPLADPKFFCFCIVLWTVAYASHVHARENQKDDTRTDVT